MTRGVAIDALALDRVPTRHYLRTVDVPGTISGVHAVPEVGYLVRDPELLFGVERLAASLAGNSHATVFHVRAGLADWSSALSPSSDFAAV